MSVFQNFNFSLLDSADFKEDSVRELLITPLLNALGYSALDSSNRVIRSKTLTHPFATVGSNRKRKIKSIPDYLLEVDGKYTWVLDAKSPDQSVTDSKHKQQAYFYAIHPEVRVDYYGLCNGREFILFHVNQDEAVIFFNLEETDKHFGNLSNLISPQSFSTSSPVTIPTPKRDKSFDYLSVKPLGEITKLQKQSAKRHYGVHGYFTKQVWNVVRDYILNFTQPGDIVLDPFGGSGVTVIEAIMNGRKGVHIDLNPLSKFLVDSLLEPVDFNLLASEYQTICDVFTENAPETNEEIQKALNNLSYPTNISLPKSSDVETVEELFSDKQLVQLAYLRALIDQVSDSSVRSTLKLMFSGVLNQINLTYHASGNRSGGRGDSGMFRYYRYRIAPNPSMLDIMQRFELRYRRVIAAKKEIAPIITRTRLQDATIIQGSATDLSAIETGTIDYIYTDPPYGAKIAYLDLSTMWNAWLDLPVTQNDKDLEVIEGGEQNKSSSDYVELLAKSIQEMFRVLKYDRWMSFVFAHKDPKFWYEIVYTAEKAGFEYAGAVRQSNGKTSYKKRQNPFRVIEGQLIINFKKVRNPQSIMRVDLGAEIAAVVEETIEGTIVSNDGATLEEINDDLIMRGLELGFLDVLSKEYQDISPFLEDNFDFDSAEEKFHIRPNKKIKARIEPRLRIRYYLISYLRRQEKLDEFPTSDDIVWHVMPLLKNGKTPEKQTILNVLEEIAVQHGDGWRLVNTNIQPGLGF